MEEYMRLLLYMDRKGIVMDMKTVCNEFIEHFTDSTIGKFHPLTYLLEIDVMDLLDQFPEIGFLLINEPLKFNNICNDILFACVQFFESEFIQHIRQAQVRVTLRVKCVPKVMTDKKSRYESLTTYYGTLIYISKPTSSVLHSVWTCPEECEGNEVILHYIPKVSPKCFVCKSILFENSGLRRCGERVIATFKSNYMICKNFYVTDDLIKKLNLGSNYAIHIVVLKKTVAVWSLEEISSLHLPKSYSVPTDIREIFTQCKEVPWKFIYCLASSVGIHTSPFGCFMNVKINLIVSLVSVKAHARTGSPIVHFLAAGYDTSYVCELMSLAASLSDRYTVVGVSNTSVTTALTAASGGICLMPLQIQFYTHKHIHTIISALETNSITYEGNSAKLKCAVWAHGRDFKKLSLHNIGSVFGIVSRGDYGENLDEIVDLRLQQAEEAPKITQEEIKALKDIATYIDLVADIRVTLSNVTEKILRSYFLAARRESPNVVPVATMGALAALCMTSAKLCQRNATTTDDAVFAIWLHVCGTPEPRYAPDEYLQTPPSIKKLHKIIDDFKDWLEKFIGQPISTF
ncbi:unnamed protein product [Leptidea sinapis]|uniref:MCMDC2 N-terminal domain-containing protein n=1 Tax=Leptidea sinapis TaxID=189913 RepID=A0A5E4QZE2_9NEOP|nr:unnamed protein product [Leptidea sinapis]